MNSKQMWVEGVLSVMLGACSIWAPAQQPTIPYLWTPVKIGGGGYVPGVLYHPAQRGLMYARTDIGGAYRRDVEGGQWIPLTDWAGADNKSVLGIESLAIDRTDVKRLYLVVGEYTQSWASNGELLRSDNQGRTFEHIALPFKVGGNEDGRGSGERLVVDPANSDVLLLGTRHNALWRSTDRAAHWTKLSGFPAIADNGVGVFAEVFGSGGTVPLQGAMGVASKTIYAAVSTREAGLLRSDDGGMTWVAVPKQPRGLLLTNMAIGANGVFYLTYADAPGPSGITKGAVWRLDLATGKWTDVTPMLPAFHWPDGSTTPPFGYGGVTVSADHPDTVLVSTLDRWATGDTVYRSTDGGKHWLDIANALQPRSAPGNPWLRHEGPPRSTGSWPTSLAIDPFDVNHVSLGTGEAIWTTRDANAAQEGHVVHWAADVSGIEEVAVLALLSPPVGPHLLSAVNDIGGFRHDDLNVSPKGGSFKNPELADTSGLAYAAQDPALMVRVGFTYAAGTAYGAISQNQGLTWTPFAKQPLKTKGLGSVALSADGKSIVWASAEAPVSVSRDMGRSWVTVPGLDAHALLAADPVDPAKFYAYSPSSGTVLVSTDAGSSFSAYARGLPPVTIDEHGAIHAVSGSEGDLWISSARGLFHSPASGTPFDRIAGVEQVLALGFGKEHEGASYSTLFLSGRVQGISGVFASLDSGGHWFRIDDDAHQYGEVRVITGDPRLFGRVYLGTEGRGILYGDPRPNPR